MLIGVPKALGRGAAGNEIESASEAAQGIALSNIAGAKPRLAQASLRFMSGSIS